MNEPREIDIHLALTRPLLLAGAERELVLCNLTIIMALIFGVGFHWASISVAVLLATVGHYALRRLARHDPQMRALYIRHLRYRDYYPAQASIHSKPQLIKDAVRE